MRSDELYIEDKALRRLKRIAYEFNSTDKKIFQLLAEGFIPEEIEQKLYKSKRTIANRITNAKWILNANSSYHFIAILIKKKIITLAFILLSFFSFSQPCYPDIVGGGITWITIGDPYCSPQPCDSVAYRVKLKLYAQFPYRLPDTVDIIVYNMDDSSFYAVRHQSVDEEIYLDENNVPCLPGNPQAIKMRGYYATFDFKTANIKGWQAVYQSQ